MLETLLLTKVESHREKKTYKKPFVCDLDDPNFEYVTKGTLDM